MFLSIITPFFNCYGNIQKCITSLENQTCDDFELILIDDASTDILSSELDRTIERSHLNIYLLHNNKNQGPGPSRNKGINTAHGDYILFLDSDDWLRDDAVQLLQQLVLKQSYDCILFDFFIIKNKKSSRSTVEKLSQGTLDKKQALLYSSGSVCCKLYRTKLITNNNIQFPDIYIKEDMVFNKIALSYCETIFYLKKSLYYYSMHPNSLMHSTNAFEINNDIMAFQIIEDKLSLYPDILEELFLLELLYAGTLHMLCAKKEKQAIANFISSTTQKYPGCFESSYLQKLPLRMRLFLFGVKHNYWSLLYIMAYLKVKFRY